MKITIEAGPTGAFVQVNSGPIRTLEPSEVHEELIDMPSTIAVEPRPAEQSP